MNNTVVGIAVLDRTKGEDGKHREVLIMLCHYSDGSKQTTHLPVRPKGAPEFYCSWEYEVKGDNLTVRPSVKISTTRPVPGNPAKTEEVELFHNSGEWVIPFKEFVPGEYLYASDLFRKVNGIQLEAP